MADPPREPKQREAARVWVIDPDQRVLLIHCWDMDDHSNRFWVTPGGGLDPGESYADAAKREAFEELGLVVDDVGESVYERQTYLHFLNMDFDQHELYFVVRVDAPFDPHDQANWTDVEQKSIIGFKWWTLDELRNTDEVVFPEGLADLIDGLLSGT